MNSSNLHKLILIENNYNILYSYYFNNIKIKKNNNIISLKHNNKTFNFETNNNVYYYIDYEKYLILFFLEFIINKNNNINNNINLYNYKFNLIKTINLINNNIENFFIYFKEDKYNIFLNLILYNNEDINKNNNEDNNQDNSENNNKLKLINKDLLYDEIVLLNIDKTEIFFNNIEIPSHKHNLSLEKLTMKSILLKDKYYIDFSIEMFKFYLEYLNNKLYLSIKTEINNLNNKYELNQESIIYLFYSEFYNTILIIELINNDIYIKNINNKIILKINDNSINNKYDLNILIYQNIIIIENKYKININKFLITLFNNYEINNQYIIKPSINIENNLNYIEYSLNNEYDIEFNFKKYRVIKLFNINTKIDNILQQINKININKIYFSDKYIIPNWLSGSYILINNKYLFIYTLIDEEEKFYLFNLIKINNNIDDIKFNFIMIDTYIKKIDFIKAFNSILYENFKLLINEKNQLINLKSNEITIKFSNEAQLYLFGNILNNNEFKLKKNEFINLNIISVLDIDIVLTDNILINIYLQSNSEQPKNTIILNKKVNLVDYKNLSYIVNTNNPNIKYFKDFIIYKSKNAKNFYNNIIKLYIQ